MNKVIIVTGTPGTGKTNIASSIARHYNYEYIRIGDHKDYVTEEYKGVKIIDVDKMIKWIKEMQKASDKALVIDSHLGHHYPKELTHVCFVLRCDPQELKLRLKKRGYSDKKIEINLEAEAMDLILQEAIEEGHMIHEIDTTHKEAKANSWEAIKVLDKSIKPSYGKIDFSYYLLKQ